MQPDATYETIVGLEVHVRLLTNSKLFSSDANSFGKEPNSHVSPITLAHPGTLPKLNRMAVVYAVRLGLACRCDIAAQSYFARKNYFYPDLPKGYQISQHSAPICNGGSLVINIAGRQKLIRIHHIHLEEDAGKSIHDLDPNHSCLDFNRAGTPLVELVTEPDLRSGEEAHAFLVALRKLVRYLGISNGNMEEGSLRCDANISVRKKGDAQLGTRVEIKNLNSMRHVRTAVDNEALRLAMFLRDGKPVLQETRGFDARMGQSFSLREKEEAEDYRYFPDPDLPPFRLTREFIDEIRGSIPVLEQNRVERYRAELGLSEYDAAQLADDRPFSDYFEAILAEGNSDAKSAANWMLGPVRTWLNENNFDIDAFPVSPAGISRLIALVNAGQVSHSVASSKLFAALIAEPARDPEQIAREQYLLMRSDVAELESVAERVLQAFPEKVQQYRRGKKGLLAMFVGEVMKRTGGTADPGIVNRILLQKLNLK